MYGVRFLDAAPNTDASAAAIFQSFHSRFDSHVLPVDAEIFVVLGFGKPTIDYNNKNKNNSGIFELTPEQKLYVQTATDLVRQDLSRRFVLVTGGYGEAIVMANFALVELLQTAERPLHPMQVLAETSSRTTVENALHTRDMLKQSASLLATTTTTTTSKNVRLVLVARAWHLPRARLIFESVFASDANISVSPGLSPPPGMAVASSSSSDDLVDWDHQVQILHKNVQVLRAMGYRMDDQQVEAAARAILETRNQVTPK